MNILVLAKMCSVEDPPVDFIKNQMKAFKDLGHHVRVIAPIPLGKEGLSGRRFDFDVRKNVIEGMEYYFPRYLSLSNYGVRNGFNAWSMRQSVRIYANKMLEDFEPDVLHVHFLDGRLSAAKFLKKRLNVPVVVTAHGSDISAPYKRGRIAELKPYCDAADTVVTVSSALKRKLEHCGTETPLSVILNGFAVNHLVRNPVKRPLSFLQAGNLIRQKGNHITLQAFAKIYSRHKDARLTIIGRGPERKSLERLTGDLGLSDAVTFSSRVPNEIVLRKMAESQFFIMPSVREGFGIVYLEAMASRCITIGTEGEGIADLIRDGENGFLVPAGDVDAIVKKVERCIADSEQGRKIADKAHSEALALTWENNAGQYVELFEQLINRQKLNDND